MERLTVHGVEELLVGQDSLYGIPSNEARRVPPGLANGDTEEAIALGRSGESKGIGGMCE